MRIAKLLVSALVMISAATGLAAEKAKTKSLHDQFTGQGYGMAGCGLGSVVFGDKPGMIQVVAVTVNGTGIQTFGISSGTSNCGESGRASQAHQYIEVNKVVLEKEISRGQGETLASLSQLIDCKSSSFGSDLKNNYSTSFPHGGASAEAIQALAYKSCGI